jgi:two-component system, response regulator PdtaR
VALILEELGPLPVIFITATPESCIPCDPPARVFPKPVHELTVVEAFRELVAMS